jgi:branched-chain amino acid transport system substrate-binding protein
VRKLTVASSLVLLLAVAVGCLSPLSARPTFKIGLVAPFEGLYRYLGYGALYAVNLALEECNQGGGVQGYLVELVALNDDQDPDSAAQSARELGIDPDVMAVIGHYGEETTLAALPVYEETGLALVVPGCTAAAVTRSGYSQTYRLVADDVTVGEAAARYAVLSEGATRIAVFGGAEDLVRAFVDLATDAGAEVFVHQEQDREALLTALDAEDPDLLFFGGEGLEGAELLLALRERGQDLRLVGGNGLNTPHFVQAAGEAAAGTAYVAVTPPTPDGWFSEAYSERSGASPPPYAALSYDAAGLLLKAAGECIAREGRPSRRCVAQALANVKEYEGLTGTISFDDTGQATAREVYLYEINDAQYPGELRACPLCSP